MFELTTKGMVGAVMHWTEYHVVGGFEDVKHPIVVGAPLRPTPPHGRGSRLLGLKSRRTI